MKSETKSYKLNMPFHLYKDIKRMAVETDKTMKDVMIQAIEHEISNWKKTLSNKK